MGYTKYDLDRLRDKENDIKRITENIDSICNKFKGINNTIDIDIKLRDNIYNQFSTLIKDLENLVERTFNADKVINSAIFEYSSGEQQINTIFNGLVDIANMFHDKNHAQTQSDKTSITGINIVQKWFRGLKDYYKSKLDHIKRFLDEKKIHINNKDYSKAKNTNSDIKISYLSSSQNNFDYTSKERITKIQQFIKNKGINIEVTGKLDRATFQASLMVGIDELKDNGFIQKDSYRSNDLNLYTLLQNNPIMYIDPNSHYNNISYKSSANESVYNTVENFLVGMSASITDNLLHSSKNSLTTVTTVLEVMETQLSNAMGLDQRYSVLMDDLTREINKSFDLTSKELITLIENKYVDDYESYYLGREIADFSIAAAGTGLLIKGAAETISGVTGIVGSIAGTVGTGGAGTIVAAPSVAASVGAVTAGVAETGIGWNIAKYAYDNGWKNNTKHDLAGNAKSSMLGQNGTKISSKTVWENGKTERIDVENPAPGKRKGQIHYHEPNNNKWYFDEKKKVFYNYKTFELAPKSIQKLLKNKEVQKAIDKALKFLGEDKIF